jgi:hypothetical protein
MKFLMGILDIVGNFRSFRGGGGTKSHGSYMSELKFTMYFFFGEV